MVTLSSELEQIGTTEACMFGTDLAQDTLTALKVLTGEPCRFTWRELNDYDKSLEGEIATTTRTYIVGATRTKLPQCFKLRVDFLPGHPSMEVVLLDDKRIVVLGEMGMACRRKPREALHWMGKSDTQRSLGSFYLPF